MIARGLDQDHDLGLRAQVMKFIQVVDRDLVCVPGLDLSQEVRERLQAAKWELSNKMYPLEELLEKQT